VFLTLSKVPELLKTYLGASYLQHYALCLQRGSLAASELYFRGFNMNYLFATQMMATVLIAVALLIGYMNFMMNRGFGVLPTFTPLIIGMWVLMAFVGGH
jgi:hypothetical protein